MSYLESGYNESEFNDDYWLLPEGNARADKTGERIFYYFKDLFKVLPKGKVLDIGAGCGNIVSYLRRHNLGTIVEGCEYSVSGRRISDERFRVSLLPCDLRSPLPYETSYFDYSYCIGVLSMIPEQYLANALAEIFRVTKYAVLVNIGTTNPPGFNLHHITRKSLSFWFDMFKSYSDITSLQPPQKIPYGIGMLGEFAGLYTKDKGVVYENLLL